MPGGTLVVGAVDAPEPLSAVIRMTRPHTSLLQAPAAPLMPIVPKHVYGDGRDPKIRSMNATPVGSGPFRFAEWARGRHLILERNDDFSMDGLPYLERIVRTATAARPAGALWQEDRTSNGEWLALRTTIGC